METSFKTTAQDSVSTGNLSEFQYLATLPYSVAHTRNVQKSFTVLSALINVMTLKTKNGH